jgi:hypothetical protein
MFKRRSKTVLYRITPLSARAYKQGAAAWFACALLACLSVAYAEDFDSDLPPRMPTANTQKAETRFSHIRANALNTGYSEPKGTPPFELAPSINLLSSEATAADQPVPIAQPLDGSPPLHPETPTPPWVSHDDAAPMEDLWLLPKLFRPEGYGRSQGQGEPLISSSWLNRPYYAGFFIGGINGDTLIAGEINQSVGFFGGVRLGWDYDPYWGIETRLGFSELGLDFIDEPSVDGLATDLLVWDTSLVYFPWGDSRWRPYGSVGIGLVDFDFLDQNGLRHSDAVIGVPWGIGLKYRQSDWISLRFDLLDNVAFGGKAGFETMNYLSLTAGFEFRFGGTRKSYFPWNPSRTIR